MVTSSPCAPSLHLSLLHPMFEPSAPFAVGNLLALLMLSRIVTHSACDNADISLQYVVSVAFLDILLVVAVDTVREH